MLHFTERIGAETDLDFIKDNGTCVEKNLSDRSSFSKRNQRFFLENELQSEKKLLCTLFERSYERVSCHQAKGMGNSE